MLSEPEGVDFGALPPKIDALLQQGVVAYRHDREEADRLFQEALTLAPQELASYYCLYKIHCYMGSLELAATFAEAGLREATRQLGWPTDPNQWPPNISAGAGSARFALFTLKALTFIQLKRGDAEAARKGLRALATIDPANSVGWSVIDELFQGVERG